MSKGEASGITCSPRASKWESWISAGLWMVCNKATNGVGARDEGARGGGPSACGAHEGNTTGVGSGGFLEPSAAAAGIWKAPVRNHMRILDQLQCFDLTEGKVAMTSDILIWVSETLIEQK